MKSLYLLSRGLENDVREAGKSGSAVLLTVTAMGGQMGFGGELTDDFRMEFDFGPGSGSDSDEAPDFSGQQPLGACPKCGARVFEHGVAYVCEKALGPNRGCDFRSGRLILQQPIVAAARDGQFDIDATVVSGWVNCREYWMNACTSPSVIVPDATRMPPTTAMAT